MIHCLNNVPFRYFHPVLLLFFKVSLAVWSGLHQVLERLFLELEGKQKVDLMASFSKPLLKSARIFFSQSAFLC